METTAESLTLDQYARHEEPGEHWVTELVEGVVVREPRPGAIHGSTQVELARHLSMWARAHGARVTAESGYILRESPPTLRGPDLAVVIDDRGPEGQPGGWIRGAPDLAVEILSASDTSAGIHEKTLDYLSAGARCVWIVDPGVRTITIFRSDGSARLLRESDTLENEEVPAGFSLSLEELFGKKG